jgi:hypothetical protein
MSAVRQGPLVEQRILRVHNAVGRGRIEPLVRRVDLRISDHLWAE